MLTSTTIASNRESSKDQAAHSRLLFNTTVRSKSDGDPSEVLTLCLHFLVGTRPACNTCSLPSVVFTSL